MALDAMSFAVGFLTPFAVVTLWAVDGMGL